MAARHGGYRRPASPAPVSGPGSLSRRTDGGPASQVLSAPTGLPYGEHQAILAQERTAPMAGTSDTPDGFSSITDQNGGGGTGIQGAAPTVPLSAPSTRPSEHVMTGTDFGPGPGSEVLPVEHTTQFAAAGPMTQLLQQLSSADTSGVLGKLFAAAKGMGA